MSMTSEALEIIEADAARAPAPMLNHYIALVRSSLSECSREVAEHAQALLLKLEHLARSQSADTPDKHGQPAYLAPCLTLAEPVREAA